jgi:F-type H+-transporting ATPase subunit b
MQLTILVPSEADAPLEHESPLIDIDHTVWIQLALFLVVAFLGSRLLFRPYLRMRDERSAGIEGARDEAARLSAEAEARLAHYQSEMESARARAQDERRKVRSEAANRQREIVDLARQETGRTFEQARARIESESKAARDALLPRAAQLADEIAGKLLGRGVS